MKRISIISGLSCCVIIPVLTVFIMGVLSGIWFDAEDLLKRPDIEVYETPMYQYAVYYLTLFALSIIEIILIIKYKKSSTSLFRSFFIAIACIVWIITVLFFVFSI
jgi:hypothetical protein